MSLTRTVDSKLVDQAKTFEVIAWIAVVVIALKFLLLLKLLTLISPLYDAFLLRNPTELWAAAQPVLRRLVTLLPVVFYLGGVLAAAGIFRRVAEGELFSRANSAALAEVGASLLWGAGASAVGVPWLFAWLDGDYGFGGIRGDLEIYVVVVIGGAILVLGRMMAQAGRLQSELDAII